MRFRIPELFLGAFLAVAIFATGMLFATSYYSSPTTNNQSKQTESTAQDGHAGIPITENAADSQTAQHKEEKSEFWSAKLTDWLLASFTLFLVAFTGALVRSTNRLWQAAIDQGRLTENAFAQLEGPLIDISKITAEIEVASPHYSAENGPRVSVHFKNHGRGPASITMLNCRFAFIEKLPDIPPYLKGTARATTLILGSGQETDAPYIYELEMPQREPGTEATGLFLFFGFIEYRGVFGGAHTYAFGCAPDRRHHTFQAQGGDVYNYRKYEPEK